jgi:alanine dehydrogenase
VYTGAEAYGRAQTVFKVAAPTTAELDWLVEGQTIVGFLHLASAHPDKVQRLLARRITAVAYEQIALDDGTLPVLKPLSQICGRMAVQIAGRLLQNDAGGKGVLLSGVTGVPPANVVIIGAGTVGLQAARALIALGAHVFLLDDDLTRLQAVDELLDGRAVTMVAHEFNVARLCAFADVVIGAVLIPGQRAPIVVPREVVHDMRPRSVILDISIDQGGCVETSHPTTHANPTFLEEGVWHYCVPNVPGVVARTATHAYLNAAWPYIRALAARGHEALSDDPTLARGVCLQDGQRRQRPG